LSHRAKAFHQILPTLLAETAEPNGTACSRR
jgi:hypothetical protein